MSAKAVSASRPRRPARTQITLKSALVRVARLSRWANLTGWACAAAVSVVEQVAARAVVDDAVAAVDFAPNARSLKAPAASVLGRAQCGEGKPWSSRIESVVARRVREVADDIRGWPPGRAGSRSRRCRCRRYRAGCRCRPAAVEHGRAIVADEGVVERVAGGVDRRRPGQGQVLDVLTEQIVGDRRQHRVDAFVRSARRPCRRSG